MVKHMIWIIGIMIGIWIIYHSNDYEKKKCTMYIKKILNMN